MKETILNEALVPEYTLPYDNAFNSLEGWEALKPEIIKLFEDHFFGKIPRQKAGMSFSMISFVNNALSDKATKKTIRFNFDEAPSYSFDINLYEPKAQDANGVFLRLNFFDEVTADERIIRWTETKNRAYEKMIDEGFACATVVYSAILPDNADAFPTAYEKIALASGDEVPLEETGAISCWAWGIMRMCDYFSQESQYRNVPLFVFGHSRLGKTALWAGANDKRLSYIISNESGCGGAAISRRCYGETIEKMNDTFPHWLCKKAKDYNDNETKLPIDQHLLIALIAPRAVYVASAEGDQWSDPMGEFLGAKHANSAYKLYGCYNKLEQFPKLHSPVGDNLRYHIRAGVHDETDYDWNEYLDLAKNI